MTIFGHTLPEVQKSLIAVAALLIAAVALVFPLHAGFQEAVETLIIAAIGLAGVFAIPNPSPDDVYKAFSAFVGAAMAIVEFYQTIPTATGTKILALAYAIAVVYCIWRVSNKKPAINKAQARLAV